jgi:hypothetical protein
MKMGSGEQIEAVAKTVGLWDFVCETVFWNWIV